MAGLLQNNDIEAWINATLMSTYHEFDKSIIVNVVRVAYHYNEEDNILELNKQLQEIDEEFMTIVMNAVDTILPKTKADYKTIRYFNEDEGYIIMNDGTIIPISRTKKNEIIALIRKNIST